MVEQGKWEGGDQSVDGNCPTPQPQLKADGSYRTRRSGGAGVVWSVTKEGEWGWEKLVGQEAGVLECGGGGVGAAGSSDPLRLRFCSQKGNPGRPDVGEAQEAPPNSPFPAPSLSSSFLSSPHLFTFPFQPPFPLPSSSPSLFSPSLQPTAILQNQLG